MRTEASFGDEHLKNEREERSDDAVEFPGSKRSLADGFGKKTSKQFFVGNCGERVVK